MRKWPHKRRKGTLTWRQICEFYRSGETRRQIAAWDGTQVTSIGLILRKCKVPKRLRVAQGPPVLIEADEVCQLGQGTVTGEEAEDVILRFLRDAPGRLFSQWQVLNLVCVHSQRDLLREERRFYLRQLNRLVQEHKVVRYRRGLQRGKIRISEAFV